MLCAKYNLQSERAFETPCTSNYRYQLRHYDKRQNFVKFKISNHKLMIEQGRYQIDRLPRENRLCPLCN